PDGRAIPTTAGEVSLPVTESLSVMTVGARSSIVAVDLPEPLATFAADQGLAPGGCIEVLGVGKGGDRLVAIDGACLHLGTALADGVRVEIQ
ncbi:MAG: ferrous iron transport protein A, partial [Acidimicrobiia bacterium]|nr:ferrous iron transport protein A [Acidimicrobiia bacterium]